MKKYLLYTVLFALTALSACKRGIIDPAPGDRPEEKISATLTNYSNTLTSAPNGWKAFLLPEGGGVYLFSMKFTAANRVSMLSDFNATVATTAFESSYRLRQQQAPSLLFDTYSYIHLLADPDPSVAGGSAGNGLYSDFEFYFDSTSGDTLKLVGNRLGSKLMLVKATSAADYSAFPTGTADVLTKLGALRTYFKRTTIGGVDCELRIDQNSKTITFSYLASGALKSVSSQFYVDGTIGTLILLNPLTIGTVNISTIKSMTSDVTAHTFSGTINGTAFTVREATIPLSYDLTAASRYINSPPNGYAWFSNYGTTVDGVQDGYRVTSIPGWNLLVFYPKYQPTYTRLGYFVNGAYAAYGPAPIYRLDANGRLYCNTSAGTFGTTPTAYAAIVNSTNAKFMDVNGLYVVQTSDKTFDTVNASDARTWISWYSN